jgi:hypothetical protein
MPKITNKNILKAAIRSKIEGHLTNDLNDLLLSMAERIIKRKWSKCPFKDDLMAYTQEMIHKHWWRFDPNRFPDKGIAYFTSCIHGYLVQCIHKKNKGMIA